MDPTKVVFLLPLYPDPPTFYPLPTHPGTMAPRTKAKAKPHSKESGQNDQPTQESECTQDEATQDS